MARGRGKILFYDYSLTMWFIDCLCNQLSAMSLCMSAQAIFNECLNVFCISTCLHYYTLLYSYILC